MTKTIPINGLPQGPDAAREFFKIFLTNATGHLALFSANKNSRKIDSFPIDEIENAVQQAMTRASEYNVYFGLGLLADQPTNGRRGKAEDVGCITMLWLEIDIKGPGHKADDLPPDLEAGMALLDGFALPPSIIIHSGGGIHLYWILDEPLILDTPEAHEEAHSLTRRLQATIRQKAKEYGWKVDQTADLARVLRVPGTYNYKSAPPLPVNILEWNPDWKYSTQDFDEHCINLNVPCKPTAKRRTKSGQDYYSPTPNFPPADAMEIVKHCPWFSSLLASAADHTEPEWFEMLANLVRCENGESLAHEYSKKYDGYDEDETTEKLHRASRYSPMKCATIMAEFQSEHCETCLFANHIKAPIQLGDTRPGRQAMLAFWMRLPLIQEEPSLVFAEETLDLLSVIQRDKLDVYSKIQGIFKNMGIGITAYNQAMKNHLQRKLILSGAPYRVEKNTMIWDKPTKTGISVTPLSNFASRISMETTKDDGLNTDKFFRIESVLSSGKKLPEIEVAATEFNSMDWVIQRYGACAIVYPQTQSHMRAAIQVCSGNYDKVDVYGHTGWKKIDDIYFFLTQSGATDDTGIHDHVEVDLGQKVLNEYALVPTQDNEAVVAAIKASLRLLDMVPAHIAYSVLGAIYRAPLGEAAQVDMSLFLYGYTGTRKSELAAIAQRHYGEGFHGKNLPANWTSTANALEKIAFIAKDCILVVDDFIPKGSQYDINAEHKKAERVLRAQGNNAGRGRMSSSTALQTTYYPRGLILATGEELPRGQSLRARILILELSNTDMDLGVLTEMQKAGNEGQLVLAMSAYIAWLAPQLESLKQSLPDQAVEYRNKAMELEMVHGRTPNMVATLMLGLEQFAHFAEAMGAMTEDEKSAFLQKSWEQLFDAARRQAGYQHSECPVTMYFHFLKSALQSGKCHLLDFSGGHPATPDNWSWQLNPGDPSGQRWQPKGEHIGWVVGNDIYLTSAAAYGVAQSMAQRQGLALNVGEKTLNKHLHEKKKLKTVRMNKGKTEVTGYTVQKLINKSKKNVLHLDESEFTK